MRFSVFGGVGLGPLTTAVAATLDDVFAVVTMIAVPTPGITLLLVGEVGLPTTKFRNLSHQNGKENHPQTND
jgi:hypothetical protein